MHAHLGLQAFDLGAQIAQPAATLLDRGFELADPGLGLGKGRARIALRQVLQRGARRLQRFTRDSQRVGERYL